MTGSPAQRTLRPLVGLAIVQFTLSALFIIWFAQAFGYGRRLVVLHLAVLGAAGALAALALHALLRRSRHPATRRLTALAIASLMALLALLYAADALSTWHWRFNVTYDLAARYLARPLVVAGYAQVVIGLPPLAGAVLIAVLTLAGLARSRRLDDALAQLQRGPASQARRTTRVLAGAFAVSAATAVAIVATVPAGQPRRQLLQREPLAGFVVDPVRPDALGMAALAAQYRVEGPFVRARYPGTAAAFDQRTVVLVVADSLRADHMSLYGYARPTTPFLDGLREQGRLRQVRHALATCPESACGIASLLTSKTYGSLVPENFKLHELFADLGYDVHFLLSGDHDWLGLRRFYGSAITTYFDGSRSRRHDPTDDRLIFEGLDAIPPGGDRPAFFYAHLMSTHVLGVRQERHLLFRPSRAYTPYALYGRDSATMRVNNYDNGVRQADAILEELFAALDARGDLRDALVVITADHGEGLGERGPAGFGHGKGLYQEFIRIPLLIYDGGDAGAGTGYANLEFATQIDVAPTIVDRLGLPVPSSWEGRSLLEPGAADFSDHVLFNPPFQAVLHRTGDLLYKLVRHGEREELFELSSDPGERVDLLGDADEALLERLRERLDDAIDARARGIGKRK